MELGDGLLVENAEAARTFTLFCVSKVMTANTWPPVRMINLLHVD